MFHSCSLVFTRVPLVCAFSHDQLGKVFRVLARNDKNSSFWIEPSYSLLSRLLPSIQVFCLCIILRSKMNEITHAIQPLSSRLSLVRFVNCEVRFSSDSNINFAVINIRIIYNASGLLFINNRKLVFLVLVSLNLLHSDALILVRNRKCHSASLRYAEWSHQISLEKETGKNKMDFLYQNFMQTDYI